MAEQKLYNINATEKVGDFEFATTLYFYGTEQEKDEKVREIEETCIGRYDDEEDDYDPDWDLPSVEVSVGECDSIDIRIETSTGEFPFQIPVEAVVSYIKSLEKKSESND